MPLSCLHFPLGRNLPFSLLSSVEDRQRAPHTQTRGLQCDCRGLTVFTQVNGNSELLFFCLHFPCPGHTGLKFMLLDSDNGHFIPETLRIRWLRGLSAPSSLSQVGGVEEPMTILESTELSYPAGRAST